jgi:hypothetical protein
MRPGEDAGPFLSTCIPKLLLDPEEDGGDPEDGNPEDGAIEPADSAETQDGEGAAGEGG